MILARLALVYGVPAVIVMATLVIVNIFAPQVPGQPNSDATTIIFFFGFLIAMATCFFFHFNTRKWRDW